MTTTHHYKRKQPVVGDPVYNDALVPKPLKNTNEYPDPKRVRCPRGIIIAIDYEDREVTVTYEDGDQQLISIPQLEACWITSNLYVQGGYYKGEW